MGQVPVTPVVLVSAFPLGFLVLTSGTGGGTQRSLGALGPSLQPPGLPSLLEQVAT